MMIIAKVDVGSDGGEIADLAGGLQIERDVAAALHPVSPVEAVVAPGQSQTSEITDAIREIEPIAIASAEACPRRFALQWALGDTHSYPAEFQHKMLFGNVAGALAQHPAFGLTELEGYTIARNIWRHLTPGERLSSLRQRRVLPQKKQSADWRWVFTLGGSKDQTDDKTSSAYRAAMGRKTPTAESVAPTKDSGAILPQGNPSAELCRMCPVRPGCSDATYFSEEEEQD